MGARAHGPRYRLRPRRPARRVNTVTARVRTATEFAVLAVFVAATLLLLDAVFDGFALRDSPGDSLLVAVLRALAVAAVFGLLNALLWPLLLRAMLWIGPLLLFGVVFAGSAAMFLLATYLVPVATIRGVGETVLTTVALSLVTALVSGAIAARHDDAYRTMAVRRQRRLLRRHGEEEVGGPPGLLIVQLDGLGHDVLRHAIADGHVPHLAELVRSGSHHLVPWHTDWSSQTGASQLGIFYGDNGDVPAFRWYDKGLGRVVVSNRPDSAAYLEGLRAHRRGLLAGGGASRGNLFSGGADDTILVLSRMNGPNLGGGTAYGAYFVDPANATRTGVRFTAEVARELRQSWRQRRQNILPRVGRGGLYPFVRAFSTVVLTDVVVAAVIADLVKGREVVYTDLVGYDEVSHHSGVGRPETLAVLRKLDAEVGMLRAVLEETRRQYHLVLLSDHGQSQGATFRQRYGRTLRELVRDLCALGPLEHDPHSLRSHHRLLAQGIDDEIGAAGRGAEGREFAAAALHSSAAAPEAHQRTDEPVVLASGNLGMVSFPWIPGRATAEQVTRAYPRLLDELRAHPGVGFVLIARESGGSVVLGAGGSVEVDTGRVRGRDPLAPFGPWALERVRRTDSFRNTPDIMVNSAYFEQTGEVAAFEEQVGSHGGMGGPQSTAFLLHPAELPPPPSPLFGAEAVHRVLAHWRGLAHEPPGPDPGGDGQ